MALVVCAVGCSDEIGGEDLTRTVDQGAIGQVDSFVTEVRDLEYLHELAADGLIGPCMRDNGFRYWEIPADDLEDYAVAEHAIALEEDDSPTDDPNQTYFGQLSDPDKFAYGQALLGPESEFQAFETTRGESIQFLTGGCLGKARAMVTSVDDFIDIQRFLAEAESWYLSIDERIAASNEYDELAVTISDCVAAKGFEPNPDEVLMVKEAVEDRAADLEAEIGECRRIHEADRVLRYLEARAATDVLESNEGVVAAWSEQSPQLLDAVRERIRAQQRG